MEIQINRKPPIEPPIDSITLELEPYEFREIVFYLKAGVRAQGLASTPETIKLIRIFESVDAKQWNRGRGSK